jgi:deoxyadenosine/deoxycytidine kinase
MQQPEAYVGNVANSIENDIFKENTKTFLKNITDAYVQWFKKVK